MRAKKSGSYFGHRCYVLVPPQPAKVRFRFSGQGPASSKLFDLEEAGRVYFALAPERLFAP